MITRHLASRIAAIAKKYPVVTLTGLRQSGKTTLVKALFPQYPYVTLELADPREFAATDPRGFLRQFPDHVIINEAQRVPELFSYIQVLVDEDKRPGRFILTGSQNFLLLQSISQSLAGRCAICHLMPFSLSELTERPLLQPESLGDRIPNRTSAQGDLFSMMHTGFYPRIHDQQLDAQEWLANYVQSYVERDVRSIINVGDLETFGRFLRLCAGRVGQLLNLSSLGADCGISYATARRWLSVLEASFIIYQLRPHYRNFGKRLIKSPKLYFLDTGLLCYLLRIRQPQDMVQHAQRGAIFESMVISELVKGYMHQRREADLYFWRDSAGHEIDVLLDMGDRQLPIEIKSAETVASDFADGLNYWRGLGDDPNAPAALIHGGDASYLRQGIAYHSWRIL